MIIHCDGSSNNTGIVGWGLVVQHEGEIEEITGGRKVGPSQEHCHEIVAFIEAVLHAHTRGIAPSEVSFYTDDKFLVDGTQFHNVRGWSDKFTVAPALKRGLDDMIPYYGDHVLEIVMKYMEHSHIVWVKGHSGTITNLRVDHLARRAMRKIQNMLTNIKLPKNKVKIIPVLQWIRDLTIRVKLPFFDFFIFSQLPYHRLCDVVCQHTLEHIVPRPAFHLKP